jgi:hypothetical protein
MIPRYAAVFAVVALGMCLAYAEETKPVKTDAAQLERLVGQLGSDRFEEREAAFEALDKLGPLALDSLRVALKSPNHETRKRACELVQRIEKRLETAELTQPKLVHLVYNDTPVTEAVQDMARKTGFTIQIEGDQTKLNGRKLTLDTGEVPFWQAVDQFCEKAGLVERGSVATETPKATDAEQRDVAIRSVAYSGRMNAGRSDTLVLHDGKLAAVPTYYAGALRVRVLPRGGQTAGTLTVEISPEPKVGLRNILNVRVEKMLDEEGTELKTPLPYMYGPDEMGDLEMQWRGGFRKEMYVDSMAGADLSTRVPLRLGVPSGVKKLKEVRGFVGADVFTPPVPLITVEDILHAEGKIAEGKDGGSMAVSEIKRDDNGQVTIRVVVERPPVPYPGREFIGRGRVIRRGGIAVDYASDATSLGRILSLLDDKGQAYKLTAVEPKQVEAPGAVEYLLTFQPPDAAGKAAKLVYLGRRKTTIDVPFVLKDVPVP